MKLLILVCLVAAVACHDVAHRHFRRPAAVARANGGRHVQRVNTRVAVGGQHNSQTSDDKGDNQIMYVQMPPVVSRPLYLKEEHTPQTHDGLMYKREVESMHIVNDPFDDEQQQEHQQQQMSHESSVDSIEQYDGVRSKRKAYPYWHTD